MSRLVRPVVLSPDSVASQWVAQETAYANHHNCLALHRDGHVTAWVENTNGESVVPDGLRDVTAIAAGDGFSLAIVGA